MLPASILYEINPSPKSTRAHQGLGFVSATFASFLLIIMIWGGFSHSLGTWTLLIMTLPLLLFSAVSWFVLKFGGDYVMGTRVYSSSIACYYPAQRDPLKQEKILRFEDISQLFLEEDLELHRTGRRIKPIQVYRIHITKHGEDKPELFIEMLNILTDQVLKFRQLPDFLIKNNLMPSDKIDLSKMP
ncbi:MAG: hypothetical protein HXX13_13890 [Bacteroidetes bacterium]|nr:hypothetical protein [Bacteroidota bacterium]